MRMGRKRGRQRGRGVGWHGKLCDTALDFLYFLLLEFVFFFFIVTGI